MVQKMLPVTFERLAHRYEYEYFKNSVSLQQLSKMGSINLSHVPKLAMVWDIDFIKNVAK